MNRRHLLKLGASSVLAAFMSPLAFGQSNSSNAAATSAAQSTVSKMDGVVSYNAGWVIPLEDKAPLLEVEARKNKEKQESDKAKSANPSAKAGDSADKSKSLSGKFQELLGKIKGYF